MMTSFSEIVKKNISLVLIVLLAVVFCESIDMACDSFSSGGGIKGSSSISVSHSLIAFPSGAVRENNGSSNGNDGKIGEGNTPTGFFYRVGRKLLTVIKGESTLCSLASFRFFFISICISGGACLFLPNHIRFIHLKDGSK